MPLTRIEQRRATDEVYQALRQAILTRVFAPGQRLNVEDLAGNLGVSFTPVRQALQLLAAEGLIVIQPRSGTYHMCLLHQVLRKGIFYTIARFHGTWHHPAHGWT